MKKINLSKKIHPSKVFYKYIYPLFGKQFLIECDKYEDFAQIVSGHFILDSEQWDAILIEWEEKEQILS